MGELDVSWSGVTEPGAVMAGKNSFLRQTQALTQSAAPVQYPVPAETFQLLDPPEPLRSPDLKVHRDCEIFKVSVTATTPGTGDTTFQMLVGEADDPSDPLTTFTWVDIVPGGGVLPADMTYLEWWLSPRVTLSRETSRLAVNVTDVAFQVSGLIWQFLFI